MKTREILLIGAGAVVGYFLIKSIKKNKVADATEKVSETTLDPAQVAKCNKAVETFMSTAKFAQGANLEAIKKEKFEACLKGES
jgi:hypothetical protein